MSQAAPSQTPPAAATDTILVHIDGRPVTVPRTMPDPLSGKPVPTTMIQACSLAKVDVPHYCYHPRLPVAGNCRMCLVEFGLPALGPDRKPVLQADGTPEIRRSQRPAIACATPISPGMAIYTNTPGVRQMREAVLEFLLINHPLDCPICDQAGECKLQEYSAEYGQAASRFVETKVHKPKQVDLGPRIVLDDERCILCSRCIRFTRDIAGDDALGFIHRGGHSTLTHFPGRPFDNNYTLNTVDICPVGALTSKDFRFQMRVWFLKESPSLCTTCGTGCNILIGSRENKVYRYTPRDNDAVNASWMCDEGRLNYPWIGRPDRLDTPKIRKPGGRIEDGHWNAVLAAVALALNQTPQGRAAIVASARQTNEELFLLRQLAHYLGALTDSVPRFGKPDKLLVSADRNSNSTGARLAGVAANPMGAHLERIAEGIRSGTITTLLVFGEDVTRHGIGADLLGRLECLVVSDILPNNTTRLAHYLLPGCAHAEKRGTLTNVKGRVQRLSPALSPPGAARAEWEFLLDLYQSFTRQPGPGTFDSVFEWMTREIQEFRGLTWAALGDTGVTVPI